MDPRFAPHNTHWEQPDSFESLDPNLRRLRTLPLVFHSPLLRELPTRTPGIYSVTGGRQVGKTTFLKQWMLQLLRSKQNPKTLCFLTGELIDDHHVLVRLIQQITEQMPSDEPRFLILDEVTYIRDWDKGIKYLADAGLLANTLLFLTGSDLALLRDARKRFPGRRGTASRVDFHLYPLSFRDVVVLKTGGAEKENPAALLSQWREYLIHGGFLPAINDFTAHRLISPATLLTYSDWIRGDALKHGKSEHYLREILQGIQKRYGAQITWQSLSKDLSIDHHQTVADYVHLLENMDVLFVQYALLEDKLTAAPKKARKVIFNDPFIFHAVAHWLNPSTEPYRSQILRAVDDAESASKLTEAAVVCHYQRMFPTYYIKAEREVDIAYVRHGRFYPVEVKWTEQIRPEELKQIRKYRNPLVIGKMIAQTKIHGLPYESLPLHLFKTIEVFVDPAR
ncbi:MAG TPA: ATP-binding protein [Bdellovibrionota bacterium]|nr:ATP-binding protein [Bdellovibrionota bacterium]